MLRFGRYMLLPALAALAACASAGPAPAPPAFTSVQPDLFAVAGSLSNAWADFDKDGDLDLAVSLKGGEVRLYRNASGRFENVGPALGLPGAGDEIRGLSWGDYDGDGDVDLLGGSNMMPPAPNRSYVWRNDAAGFTEVAASLGLLIPGRISRQSSWIDYDNDGDLDLYAADRFGINKLYRNDDGAFIDAFGEAGPNDARASVGACWFDHDRDGDLDLFLANQSGHADALWRNDGESFTDIAPALQIDSPGRAREEGGVGCAIGDYDNDGDFDIFLAAYGPNKLYRNNGDGSFTEVAAELGVTEPDHAVGAAWGDYDNDGDLDLSVIGYEGPFGAQTPHSLLYRNDGAAGFQNVLTLDDPMNAADHSAAWVDFDSDGDLDLSTTDGYGPEGGHFLFSGGLDARARARSLAVLVLDQTGHFTRAGAEVRLYDRAGRVLASRLVDTGGGYNAQGATPVYFGLAQTGPVTVETTFMARGGPQVQRIERVKPEDYAGGVLIVRQQPHGAAR